jgi:hypothetical protein
VVYEQCLAVIWKLRAKYSKVFKFATAENSAKEKVFDKKEGGQRGVKFMYFMAPYAYEGNRKTTEKACKIVRFDFSTMH